MQGFQQLLLIFKYDFQHNWEIMKEHYAVLSGLCASAAGAFGKLSGLPILENIFLVRILFFCAMLLCNAGVWTLFVKALHQSDSSLIATVISSTSNYLFSAFLGYFLFGEVTSLFWWIGMFSIMVGLILILSDDNAYQKYK